MRSGRWPIFWALLAAGSGGALVLAVLPDYLRAHPGADAGIRRLPYLVALLGVAFAFATLLRLLPQRYRVRGTAAGAILLVVSTFVAIAILYPQTSPASYGVFAVTAAAVIGHAVAIGAAGARLLRRVPLPGCSALSRMLLALLTGWIVWGWSAFLLGLLGLFHSGTLLGLTLLCALVGWRDLHAFLKRSAAKRSPLLGRGPEGTILLAIVLGFAVLAGLTGFTRAVSAPVGYDTLMYHLPAPHHYLEVGAVDFYPEIRGSYYPPLSHMHWALFLGLGLDAGPSFMNLLIGFTLLLLAYETGRAWGSRAAGVIAAAAIAFTPMVEHTSSSVLADSAYGAVGLGAFLFLVRGVQRRRPGWILAGGWLAGGALFTKYQGMALILALALAAFSAWLVVPRPWRGRTLRWLALAAGLALVVPMPHWAHNLWHTGNPVFPLFGQYISTQTWFDAVDVQEFNVNLPRMYGVGHGAVDLLRLPWRLLLHESRYEAFGERGLGLLWLAALPVVAWGALRRPRLAPLALGAAALVVSWFGSAQVMRYLLPALSIATVLAGHGLADLVRGRARTATLLVLTLVAATLFQVQAPGALAAGGDLALAGPGRERFLEEQIATYPILRDHVAHLPPDAVVWAYMDQGAVYYYGRRVLGDWFGLHRYDHVVASIAPFRFHDGDPVLRRFDSWGVTHVLLNLPAAPAYRPEDVDTGGVPGPADGPLARRLCLLHADGHRMLFELRPAGAAPCATVPAPRRR